jgi:Uma2 family endonuclease
MENQCYTIHMALPLAVENYTYADFLEWDEDFRAELFDGEIVMMADPSTKHQRVSGELFFQIRTYLEGKPCGVFAAHFSVRLFPQKDQSDDTVFLPDMIVVCDSEKLDDKGCNGAPDLVIEIISPSTAKYDRIMKFRKYQSAGVREYWIVDPELKSVQVCVLENGRYVMTMFDETEKASIAVLEGCEIDLQKIFAE